MNSRKQGGPVVAEVDRGAGGLRAVEHAAAEALRIGAELVLALPYAITTSSTVMTAGSVVPAQVASPGLRLAVDTARRVGGPELALRVFTGEGPRSGVLPAVARRARLLVLPAGEGRGVRRLLSAQADLTLLSRVGAPTAIVPRTWDPTTARGVVVGVDGTELSVEALTFAFRLAADRKAPLTIVHAAGGLRHDAEHIAVGRAARVLAEVLAGWADEYPEVEIVRHPTARAATTALLDASRLAEVLVVGAQTSALAAVNPVVRRLVAETTCPITVVPHRVTTEERAAAARRVQPVDDVIHPTY